jgi:hypothetical protein
MLFKRTALLFVGPLLAATFFFPATTRVSAAPNLLDDLNGFDDTPLIDNPWGLVSDGLITLPSGSQLAVDDDGNINPTPFGPSAAIGDLNGDGLPDLVVADSRGYFWFFPNSGTPKQPKFTTGEVMPIWIGAPCSDDGSNPYTGNFDSNNNTIPRIQLVDYSNEKKLSIVAGNYEGKLFYIHNLGSATQPAFTMPQDLASITIPTYTDNHLWCNFLSPFLYDFTGNGQLDLIMGEGTYASNSIYRLVNKGNNGSPIFNEKFTTKIIKGWGREHLTPQVVDWNNDGKPDIISGERQGYIDIFLNKGTDPANPVFENPEPPGIPPHVQFGGTEQLGILTTVAVGDLTGNKLPNLLISNPDDHLLYAVNKGKLGEPKFDLPEPLKGVNPFPKVFDVPQGWHIVKTFSMPYVQLVCTKLKDDPQFVSPDGKIKAALKLYTVPHEHTYFRNEIYPTDNDLHVIGFDEEIPIEAGVHYDTSFWVKTSGDVENVSYVFTNYGWEDLGDQGGKGSIFRFIKVPVDAGGSWTQFKGDTYMERADREKPDTANLRFFLSYNGNGGSLSVAGFTMAKRGQ